LVALRRLIDLGYSSREVERIIDTNEGYLAIFETMVTLEMLEVWRRLERRRRCCSIERVRSRTVSIGRYRRCRCKIYDLIRVERHQFGG
jgi:hypothetical protein